VRRSCVAHASFLGASFAAAAVGGAFTARSVNGWYRTLRKPRWTPPDRVFGPVWSVLYTLIGASGWLIWRRRSERRGAAAAALAAWCLQMALNAAWSALFFGRRSTGGGLAAIIALWVSEVACAALATRVSHPAAALLLPYLAWSSFAVALNWRIWRLNRPDE
jgi:tryptophan-rich sensory protein